MIMWTDNPVLDAERYYEEIKPAYIGNCEHCSDVIREGDNYYNFDGELVHYDCLREWASKFEVNA